MPPAAAHDDPARRLRTGAQPQYHGFGRELGQRGRAVLQGKALHEAQRKVEAVERARAAPLEVGVVQIGRDDAPMDAARAGEEAVLIAPRFGPRLDEEVDHAIGRPGVEGLQQALGPHQGNVPHPAEVQHGHGGLEARETGEGLVVDWGERCALAAGGHVGAAEIVSDRQAQPLSETPGVDELHGSAALAPARRLVQHGLAMHACGGKPRDRLAGVGEKGAGGGEMLLGHGPGGGFEDGRRRIAPRPVPRRLDGRLDRGACGGAELAFRRRAQFGDALAVGVEHGHVDRVQRGAGHEAEDAHGSLDCHRAAPLASADDWPRPPVSSLSRAVLKRGRPVFRPPLRSRGGSLP